MDSAVNFDQIFLPILKSGMHLLKVHLSFQSDETPIGVNLISRIWRRIPPSLHAYLHAAFSADSLRCSIRLDLVRIT